jgi:hypothetical protein
MTILFLDQLPPHELKARREEARKLARQMLEPDDLAALLLDQSHDDLERAVNALLDAAHQFLLQRITLEELSENDAEAAHAANTRKAFRMLIEHYGSESICELAKEYEATDSAA